MNVLCSTDPKSDTTTGAVEGFKIVAEGLPCGVWMAGSDGKLEWCNRDFLSLTGVTFGEAVSGDWIPNIHPGDREAVERDWAHALASGTLLDTAARLHGAGDGYRRFGVCARPLRGANGRIEKWLGTLTDIRDRGTATETNAHVADALMKGYLSKEFPSAKGLKFDTHYQAANMERVGGDWYDVFALPDGRIAFSLGDVCGHGIDAAVKMGEAKQAIFVAACLGDPAPEKVLEHANDVIFLNNRRVSITTALYGMIDTARRTVTYASAGHHPPILARSNGETTVLPNHGFPLGVEERMPPRIRTHEFTYETGSMLVLYTDGLIEFGHDMFAGEARLLTASTETLRCEAERPAKSIADRVLGDVPPGDDVAVLTVSFGD